MTTTVDLRTLTKLRAGDSLSWEESHSNYPANDSWVITYKLIGANGVESITSTSSGATHVLTASSSTTAAWTAGFYEWSAYVEKGTERITLQTGTLTILADPSSASATDSRSHARKVLEAIQAVLEGRASKDQESYTINGRSLSRTPIADLMKMERTYAARVAQEDRAEKAQQGLGTSSKIKVRF